MDTDAPEAIVSPSYTTVNFINVKLLKNLVSTYFKIGRYLMDVMLKTTT